MVSSEKQNHAEFYHFDDVELFNLKTGPGEKRDVGAEILAVVKWLSNELLGRKGTIRAKMPQPNPDYDSPPSAIGNRGKRTRRI